MDAMNVITLQSRLVSHKLCFLTSLVGLIKSTHIYRPKSHIFFQQFLQNYPYSLPWQLLNRKKEESLIYGQETIFVLKNHNPIMTEAHTGETEDAEGFFLFWERLCSPLLTHGYEMVTGWTGVISGSQCLYYCSSAGPLPSCTTQGKGETTGTVLTWWPVQSTNCDLTGRSWLCDLFLLAQNQQI